jgi:BlaI family transcriptional regulator, penicillinase repressor
VARSGSQALTEREAQIMGVLWSHGDATAEQVREWLPDRPHDSTVRTLLRVLETKGYVERQGPGRPTLYRALVSQAKAQRSALHVLLLRLFGGSPQALVQRLIDDRKLTPEEFLELAREFAQTDEVRPSAPSSRRKIRGKWQEGGTREDPQ